MKDGGELEVYSYPLEKAHIVYMSVSILLMVEGLELRDQRRRPERGK
jgi:hypothetical protein